MLIQCCPWTYRVQYTEHWKKQFRFPPAQFLRMNAEKSHRRQVLVLNRRDIEQHSLPVQELTTLYNISEWTSQSTPKLCFPLSWTCHPHFTAKIEPQSVVYADFRHGEPFMHKFNLYDNWKLAFSFVASKISKSLFSWNNAQVWRTASVPPSSCFGRSAFSLSLLICAAV